MENLENLAGGEITRRKFVGAAAAALFAGVVITIFGCDDVGTGPRAAVPGEGGCPTPGGFAKAATNSRTGDIPSDTTHSAIVTGAQQDAGGAITLHIQGTQSHDHTLALTATDVTNIKNGVLVSKTSSTTLSHNHVVTFQAVATGIIVPSGC